MISSGKRSKPVYFMWWTSWSAFLPCCGLSKHNMRICWFPLVLSCITCISGLLWSPWFMMAALVLSQSVLCISHFSSVISLSGLKTRSTSVFSKKWVQQKIRTIIQQMLQKICVSVHCQCYTVDRGLDFHITATLQPLEVMPNPQCLFKWSSVCAPSAAHLRLQSSHLAGKCLSGFG